MKCCVQEIFSLQETLVVSLQVLSVVIVKLLLMLPVNTCCILTHLKADPSSFNDV